MDNRTTAAEVVTTGGGTQPAAAAPSRTTATSTTTTTTTQRRKPSSNHLSFCAYDPNPTPSEELTAVGNRLRFYRSLVMVRRDDFVDGDSDSDWKPPASVVVTVGTYVSTWVTGNRILVVVAIAAKLGPRIQLYLRDVGDAASVPDAVRAAVAAIMSTLPAAVGRNPVKGYPHEKKKGDVYVVRADLVTIVWSAIPGFGISQQLADEAITFAGNQVTTYRANDVARHREHARASTGGAGGGAERDADDAAAEDESDAEAGGKKRRSVGVAAAEVAFPMPVAKRRAPVMISMTTKEEFDAPLPNPATLLGPPPLPAQSTLDEEEEQQDGSSASLPMPLPLPPPPPPMPQPASPHQRASLLEESLRQQGANPAAVMSLLQASLDEKTSVTRALLKYADQQREDMSRMINDFGARMSQMEHKFRELAADSARSTAKACECLMSVAAAFQRDQSATAAAILKLADTLASTSSARSPR